MLLSRFPYVALLSMSPDNRVANAACGSGPDVATPEQLLTLLGLAVAEHGVMLAAQRAEVEERVGGGRGCEGGGPGGCYRWLWNVLAAQREEVRERVSGGRGCRGLLLAVQLYTHYGNSRRMGSVRGRA